MEISTRHGLLCLYYFIYTKPTKPHKQRKIRKLNQDEGEVSVTHQSRREDFKLLANPVRVKNFCSLISNSKLFNISPTSRDIFSLRLRQMCILEKLNFKISQGSISPDPSRVPAPSALDHILARGPTLNCFRALGPLINFSK